MYYKLIMLNCSPVNRILRKYIRVFTNVKSHVGSLDNIQHGGDVKIFDEKLKFRELATPKIIIHSSTTSNVDSSVIADDNRPPSHEEYQTLYNTPHTPVIEVMFPIMERFEAEEIPYRQKWIS
ncbi:365_t:CDS:2 [Funneliformis caledonium]|uniref:365_t:CDS:1 n=1 Tax=Funneliformis caledonium TaxID=1117310 RepID=A0A9N9EVH7_9GLOM|nr:365_t:CDS:2 [Funneliformis caledonium]